MKAYFRYQKGYLYEEHARGMSDIASESRKGTAPASLNTSLSI